MPEDIQRGLRARADQHGRTTEAEVYYILAKAIRTDSGIKLGSLLADIGREAGLTAEEVETCFSRDKSPAVPPSFE